MALIRRVFLTASDILLISIVLSVGCLNADIGDGDLDSWLSGWTKKPQTTVQRPSSTIRTGITRPAAATTSVLGKKAVSGPGIRLSTSGQNRSSLTAGQNQSALAGANRSDATNPKRPAASATFAVAAASAAATGSGTDPLKKKPRKGPNNQPTPAQLEKSVRILENHLGLQPGQFPSARSRCTGCYTRPNKVQKATAWRVEPTPPFRTCVPLLRGMHESTAELTRGRARKRT
jgi:hypothetical protein